MWLGYLFGNIWFGSRIIYSDISFGSCLSHFLYQFGYIGVDRLIGRVVLVAQHSLGLSINLVNVLDLSR